LASSITKTNDSVRQAIATVMASWFCCSNGSMLL
jgi:hypothetical protein